MKKLFILTLLVIYLIPCFGQDHEVVIQPNQEIKIAKVYDELTQQTLYEFTSYNYGYWAEQVQNDPPKNKWYNAHTALKFNLPSLPTGAYNISVKLEAYRGSYSAGDSRVVEVPDNLLFYDDDDIWYYAEIGNEYFVVDRSSGQLHDITSLYQSKIGQGYINFGIRQYQSGGYEKGYVNMYMHIYYDLPVTITAQNNFPGGKIYVDSEEKDAPWPFTKIVGETATLKAKEQNDNLGYPRIWNDIEAPLNKSKWLKNGADVGSMIEKSFVVAQSDDGKTYETGLRKNYRIDQTHKTEFDGDQTQQNTSWIVEQNTGNISTQSTRTINGKNYNFAGWIDNFSAPNPRNITPTDNQTYTALYKYPNHANTSTAYSSNSQKKLVRDTNGWLHKVYESMGKVWYERSTNNGTTWSVENNGKPLSSNDARLPSIDFFGTSYIFITWQENYEGTFKIKLAYLEFPAVILRVQDVFDPTSWGEYPPYSYDAAPVVAWTNGRLLVAWKFYGIMYRYASVDCYGPMTWYTTEYAEWIPGTDDNSSNPTIAVRKETGLPNIFHLAWQQSTTSIKYRYFTPAAPNYTSFTMSPEETPSSGDNVNYKRNPSISVLTTQPTLVWVGANYLGATKKVYKRTRGTSSWGGFTICGNEIESPTEYNGIIVWSEPNWVNKMFRWGSIKTLPTIGKYIQASNGPSANSMYAVVHRNVSPFEFQTTQSLGSLPKIIISNSGREGIISKGNAEFGFVIADVTCNGDVVAFENVNDTTVIANIGDLNNYLYTTTFTPNEVSDLVFSIAYGTNDSLEAINALTDGSNISFTLELVDANTNEIISTLDSFVFDENNICSYGEQSYNINMQGIGNRNVKLRAISYTSFNGSYNLANIYAESNILGKNNSRELSFNGGSVITTYDLYQNYPNPFNPSTTIKFQIPKDGIVTLKVYDILGNELSTLINEQKTQGRYEINFNASSLASGVYVYKLQAGEYISSKKMILLR